MTQVHETRETRVRRYQWLEVILPTVLSFPFIAVYFATPLDFGKVVGSYALLLLALQLFLSIYQYRVHDEFGRLKLLKAHMVAGLVLTSGVLLLFGLNLLLGTPLNLLGLMGLAFAWLLAFSLTSAVLDFAKEAYE